MTEAEHAARMGILAPANEDIDLVAEANALLAKGMLNQKEYEYRIAILGHRQSRVGKVIVNALLGIVVVLGLLGIAAMALVAAVLAGG